MTVSRQDAAADRQASARRRLRMLGTDYGVLDVEHPGIYPRIIERAEGVRIYDDAGHATIDTGLHWGANVVGHCRPEVAEAIGRQARTLDFTALYAGFAHEPAVELAGRLAPLLPVEDPTILFGPSGSESNELAFRIVHAYHQGRGDFKRTKTLVRGGGYHGSSAGALGATVNPMFRDRSGPLPPGFVAVAQPSPGRCGFCTRETGCSLQCAEDVERAILREEPGTIAAFVAEPVGIQQEVKVPDDRYWPAVQEICRHHGVLIVVDEVVTGFGRTGRLFASEHWGIRPDVMTMAKGITSGYVPMSATAVSAEIAELVVDRPIPHANTWAGHPLACAAALACLDIQEGEDLPGHASRMGELLKRELARLAAGSSRVRSWSAIGLLASVEYTLDGDDGGRAAAQRLRHAAYERGLFARVGVTAPNVGFTTFYPPLVIDEAEVTFMVDALADALAAHDA